MNSFTYKLEMNAMKSPRKTMRLLLKIKERNKNKRQSEKEKIDG